MDKLTLLVADDVEMNRSVIARLLAGDYQIREASNGREALAILEKEHVDAVILDIVMPVMDGIETLEAIKKREEWNAIAVLVATSQKERTERIALAVGADDVVSKPYDPTIIKQRLRNILAKKEIDKMKLADIKGISRQDRQEVDKVLDSILKNANMGIENAENVELVRRLNENIIEDITYLTRMLAEKVGN